MTILRERMLADMKLRGLAEKTQEAYLRAVCLNDSLSQPTSLTESTDFTH